MAFALSGAIAAEPTKRTSAKTSSAAKKQATTRKATPPARKPRPKRTRQSAAKTAVPATTAIAAAAAANPEIVEKRADLSELRSRIDALQKDLNASQGHKASAADRLRESEKQISTLQRELLRLSRQQNRLQENLRDLGRQSEELAGTLTQQQSSLEQLVYRQYVQGNPGSLQLLLNGDDPNQVARDLRYLSAIAHARADMLTEVRGTLKKKQALAEDTRSRVQELEDVEAAQRDKHADLLKQREERKVLLAEISGRITAQRKEIGALQRDEKRMSQLIDRLSRIIAAQAAKEASQPPPRRESGDTPPRPGRTEAENRYQPGPTQGSFSQLRGKLRLPVRGAVIGRFGAAREGGAWKGLFIRAANGSEVRAIANGRVVFADWMRGFGNLLIVDHGSDYLSIYGNNDSLLKQVGDNVSGGEPVASVGNSGGNPESGLYFELRHKGQVLDPMKWATLK